MTDTVKTYYFGCWGQTGHYMWAPNRRTDWDFVAANPWGRQIDGGLCVKEIQQPPGIALLHQKDGWTALAFWDRSYDHRGGSNSVFLSEGVLDFDQMVALGKQHFPDVWARFDFEVKLFA